MTMSFRTQLNTMSDAQREWFATAMVSMILADGTVSQAEVEKLMTSISFVRNQHSVERLKKFVHFQSIPSLGPFQGWEKEVKNRAILMLDLMDVAISDREFSAKERDQFHHIGKMLGFSTSKVDELIALGSKSIEGMA